MDNSLAMEKYNKRKVRFAVTGLWFALISGITAGVYQNITPIVSADPAINIGTSVGIVMIISLVTQCLYDSAAGLWMILWNVFTGRGIREYFRLLKAGKMSWLLLLAAIFGGPVALSCSMIGINMCGVTPALVVSSTSPVIAAIMGKLLYKEKLGARVIIGICIAVIGVIMVGWSNPEGEYPYFFLGLVISFVAAIGWGLESAVATYAADMTDPNTAVGLFRTICSGLFTFIIIIPVFGICLHQGLVGWSMIVGAVSHPGTLLAVLIAGSMCAISYCTTYVAFSRAGATRSLVLVNTYGIWSIVIGLILAALGLSDYSITMLVVIGTIVNFIGIALVIGNPKDMIKLRTV